MDSARRAYMLEGVVSSGSLLCMRDHAVVTKLYADDVLEWLLQAENETEVFQFFRSPEKFLYD